ncbi:MAG: YjjG family noncanonical pyrimidine nucleotidase [Anaerolineae bacterium]|nr:YjjG family noncanonical pyrimidine nucleotidase [Anaerolineae bacterium]
MKYKWLLFDADGTLFDYDRAEQFALQHTFGQLGYPFEERYLHAYRRINHAIWLEFEQGKIDQASLRTRRFELLFETVNITYNPQVFSAAYLANLAAASFLMAGAEETVELLSPKYNILIITNGLAEVQRPRFKGSAIYRHIKEIIISEEVGAAKPDPQIFSLAFARMRHPAKNEVLIIGDSLTSDIQGGRNYGIDTCWFNPHRQINGQILPTFEIQTLAELPRILESVK